MPPMTNADELKNSGLKATLPRIKILEVFQRSPQYCVPSGNGPVGQAEVVETKKNFDAIWNQVRNSVVAFGFQESGVEAMKVTDAERDRIFQENWDKGNGFRFMFGTFCDIATNAEANVFCPLNCWAI